jgi:hypothetical protein
LGPLFLVFCLLTFIVPVLLLYSEAGPITLPLYALAALVLLGWITLAGLSRRYSKRKTSDQALNVDSIWLLAGISNCFEIGFEGFGLAVFPLGALAFATYKLVARIGAVIQRRRQKVEAQNVSLLVLRVFSLGKKSERLFRAITKTWRYIGEVRLIAGPDLLRAGFDLPRLYAFLRRRLRKEIILDENDLHRRLDRLEGDPDPDGRFRLYEFLCTDETWTTALPQLVTRSYAVLMDLRGFSPKHAGCILEIRELARQRALERTVLVIDKESDLSLIAAHSGQSLEQIRVVRMDRQNGACTRDLLVALCNAAGAYRCSASV